MTYAKLTLQTCDPIVLKNCINKFNYALAANNTNSQTNASLRYFWPRWQTQVSRLTTIFNTTTTSGGTGTGQSSVSSVSGSYTDLINSNVIVPAYLNSSLKLNTINDMDFFYVCYAKVNCLAGEGRFELASRLIKSYESLLPSASAKSSKLVQNQQLYVSVMRFLRYMDPNEAWLGNAKRQQQQQHFNYKHLGQELLVKNCKNFLVTCKSEPGRRETMTILIDTFSNFLYLSLSLSLSL